MCYPKVEQRKHFLPPDSCQTIKLSDRIRRNATGVR
jgi:hypothetical protein